MPSQSFDGVSESLEELEVDARATPNCPESPLVMPEMPEYERFQNYYGRYWDMYMENERLLSQLNAESEERDELLCKKL